MSMKSIKRFELIKRKMETSPEFERYVNEGLMRFGGDNSLTEIAECSREPASR